MTFPAIAIAIGLVIAVLRGGRLRYLDSKPFRLWGLVPLGVGAQAVADFVPHAAAVTLLVASYAVLVTFAAANMRLPGMILVIVGMLANLVVITVNAGMPVREAAMVAAGVAEWDEVDDLELGSKRYLERPDDRLTVLGDIIPVPGVRIVVSFGDLILSTGITLVLVHLLAPPRRREVAGLSSQLGIPSTTNDRR